MAVHRVGVHGCTWLIFSTCENESLFYFGCLSMIIFLSFFSSLVFLMNLKYNCCCCFGINRETNGNWSSA